MQIRGRDGPRQPNVVATENDSLNGASMLFNYLLTNTPQIFSDVRTYWSPEAVERVTGWKPEGRAAVGADKLVGTTSIVKELPWFAQVYPRIGEIKPYAISSGSGNFNTEEVLKANADVVITSSAKDAEVLRNYDVCMHGLCDVMQSKKRSK